MPNDINTIITSNNALLFLNAFIICRILRTIKSELPLNFFKNLVMIINIQNNDTAWIEDATITYIQFTSDSHTFNKYQVPHPSLAIMNITAKRFS